MKKAFILTDGSVDLALSLNRWLATQTEPIDLTVICGFALNQTDDQPLNAALYHDAKQAAREELNRWLNFLSQPQSGPIQAELLLGEPDQILTIYLLLRRYDYLLVDGFQQDVLTTYTLYQSQTATQLQCLNVSQRPVYLPDLTHEVERDLPVIYAASQLAA